MERAAILAKVVDVVADALECDASTLSESTRYEDLGADSFDLLELVTAFEDEFGLTMDDDALQAIKTIGDSVDAIADAQ